MNHVIISIGKWGVKSEPLDSFRWKRPRPGDIVEIPEAFRRYPISCAECRISDIDRDTGRAHLVDGMGSAFLEEDGSLSISGGPFFGLPIAELADTGRMQQARFWNWGDHSPGAAQGVDYHIFRPVFVAKCHPDDIQVRYGMTEDGARNGGVYHHGPIPVSAKLYHTSKPDADGVITYQFDCRQEGVQP